MAKQSKIHLFIFSPFGYMCANEYVEKFSNKNQILNLYIISTSESSQRQIYKLIDQSKWSKLVYLYDGKQYENLNGVRKTIDLLKFFTKLKAAMNYVLPDDEIVISHLDNPYARYILDHPNSKNAECVIVDDGTASINTFSDMMKIGKLPSTPVKSLKNKGFFNFLSGFLFSVKEIPAEKVSFFSIFPLKSLPNSKISQLRERNELQAFFADGNKLTQKIQTKEIYFVGQPLVRRKVFSKQEYNTILKEIQTHFQNQGLTFLYIPHRNETVEEIDDDIRILMLDEPIEIYLRNSEFIPEVLAGFYSTCLLSLYYIFGNSMRYELFWNFEGNKPAQSNFMKAIFAFEHAENESNQVKIHR